MVKNNAFIFAAACLIGILFTLWLVSLDRTQFYPDKFKPIEQTDQFINITTTRALINLFNEHNYNLSNLNKGVIPDLLMPAIPSDFKAIKNIKKKKSLFIRFMIPIIIAEQNNIREKRTIAQLILNNTSQLVHPNSITWFNRAIKEYNINSNLSFANQKSELLKRLDELPLPLILAQAAVESGWGTSRFAIEGNSLFGQWTFSSKNALTPKSRGAGKTHQIKAFPTLQASIRSYLKNINRNNAYKELRHERQKMRQKNNKLESLKLSEGLHRYSQLGNEYVKIIQRLLNTTEFKSLKHLQ